MEFKENFNENLIMFQQAFKGDDTFKIKPIRNPNFPKVPMVALLSGAMVSSDVVDRDVLRPLSTQLFEPTLQGTLEGGILNHTVEIQQEPMKAMIQIGAGDCVILVGDEPGCIIIDAKGIPTRGTKVPETETSLLGPEDGFVENIMANLALLKKRIATPQLKSEFIVVGSRCCNKAVVCYLDGVVRPALVEKVKKRLQKINIDYVPDGNVMAELIRDCPTALFKTVGKTSRPDVLAAKLMEGRIGVILDGSPVVITVPYIFAEGFQSPDDYYQNYLYANVGRILRYVGFVVSVFFPGFYLAIVNFNPGVLPAHWFYTVLAASENVPLKTVTEMLLLFFAFEILRETGTRMPAGLGLALNVVGAVILGDAAVNSNIVSTPMVIIVAFSGVTGLMVKDLKGAVFYLRLGVILAGAIFGLPGIAFSAVFVLLHLAGIHSFGVPFLYTLGRESGSQDTLVRTPYWKMIWRQVRFTENERRQR